MVACIYWLFILIFSLVPGGITVVDETRHVFNITCDRLLQKDCQSESLKTIADKVRKQSEVEINIKVPQLQLNANISFTSISSLTVNGEPGLTTVICMSGSNATTAGIVLWGIKDKITLNHLNLRFCGSHVFEEHRIFSSAITIISCWNVELNEVIITKSRGVGLTILYHQGGRVNIKSTIFKENVLPYAYAMKSIMGGGGVYILLSPNQWKNQYSYSPMAFQFDNCTFENNTAHTYSYDFGYTNGLGVVEEGYGSGGGTFLIILNRLRDIHISFSNCNFSTNQAFIGGGLSLITYGLKAKSGQETNNITVDINNSLFLQNGCKVAKYTHLGGGAYLSFSTYSHGSGINNSHYRIQNVSFIENCAELGGGGV